MKLKERPPEYHFIARFLELGDEPLGGDRAQAISALMDDFGDDVSRKAVSLLKNQYPHVNGASSLDSLQQIYVAIHDSAAPSENIIHEADPNGEYGESTIPSDSLLLEDAKTFDGVLRARMAERGVSLALLQKMLHQGTIDEKPPAHTYPPPQNPQLVSHEDISQEQLAALFAGDAAPGPNLAECLIETLEMAGGTRNFFLSSVNEEIRADKPVIEIEHAIHVDSFQKSILRWEGIVEARHAIVDFFKELGFADSLSAYSLAALLDISPQVTLGLRKPSIMEGMVEAAGNVGIDLSENQARQLRALQESLTEKLGIATLRSGQWHTSSSYLPATYDIGIARANRLLMTLRRDLASQFKTAFMEEGKSARQAEVLAEAKVDHEMVGMGGFGRHVKPGMCISDAACRILEKDYPDLLIKGIRPKITQDQHDDATQLEALRKRDGYRGQLRAVYRKGGEADQFLETVALRLGVKSSADLTIKLNELLKERDPLETRELSYDAVLHFRNNDFRGNARGPTEAIELLCKALDFDKPHQRLMWRMTMGSRMDIAAYDTLEAAARAGQNSGILVDGLLKASGLPSAKVAHEIGGSNYVTANAGGVKFATSAKTRKFMEEVFPAAMGDEAENIAILARHDAAVQWLSHKVPLSPVAVVKDNNFTEMLRDSFKNGDDIGAFMETIFVTLGAVHSIDFTKKLNHLLKERDPEETRKLHVDTVSALRKNEHRHNRRGPVEPVEILCKALGLDEDHQRLIWRMTMGSRMDAAGYDHLEEAARREQNPGILIEGLLKASGLPHKLVNIGGSDQLASHVKGAKFKNADKARKFLACVFPIAAIPGEPEDAAIVQRHEAAIELLSGVAALPPVALARLEGKRSAREILEDTIGRIGDDSGGTFRDFINTLLKEWGVNSTEFREILAYNNEITTGKPATIGEAIIREWCTHAERPLSPYPESVVTLRTGVGLDEQDEMRIWRLMRGHSTTHAIPELIREASRTGDTGPLMKELVRASGVPVAHLERVLPTTVLQSWMNGGKVGNDGAAQRFLDLVYPAKRNWADKEPDPGRVADQKTILELLAYAPTIPERAKIKRQERDVLHKSEAHASIDAAAKLHPLGMLLEQSYREHQDWGSTVTTVLRTWDASPQGWQEFTQRHHPEGKFISYASIYDWQEQGKNGVITKGSVDVLKEAHGLTELQELIIYKTKNGRRLVPGELEKTLETTLAEGNAGSLLNLLRASSGIPDHYLKKMLGLRDLAKWTSDGYVQHKEVARKLIELTLAVESWAMEESAHTALNVEFMPRLLEALAGKAQSVAEVFSADHKDQPQDAVAFIRKLCRGMNDAQFSRLMGLREDTDPPDQGVYQMRQIRYGRHTMSEAQQQALLDFVGCKDAAEQEQAKKLLCIRPVHQSRSMVKSSSEES